MLNAIYKLVVSKCQFWSLALEINSSKKSFHLKISLVQCCCILIWIVVDVFDHYEQYLCLCLFTFSPSLNNCQNYTPLFLTVCMLFFSYHGISVSSIESIIPLSSFKILCDT